MRVSAMVVNHDAIASINRINLVQWKKAGIDRGERESGESTCFNPLLSQDNTTSVDPGAPVRRAPAPWVQTRDL